MPGPDEKLGIVDAHAGLPDEWRDRTTPAGMLQMFLLYRYGIATMDRASFGRIGAEGQHFLRLSVATAAKDLEEAVRRIDAASNDAEGFREFVGSGVQLTL